MRQFQLIAVALVVAAVLASARTPADEPAKKEAKAENKLVGTWKLVSAKYGGNEFTFPEGHTMLKHVTPTQFMWVTYDKEGKAYRSAGGPYTLKGDKYEETPEYGFGDDFEGIKGKTHSFKWKVDGKKWLHNGELSGGLTIEEVWERVEKK
jgi:hypothetical protein